MSNLILKNRNQIFFRLSLLLVFALFVLLFFNKISLSILLFVLGMSLFYVFFRKQLWLFFLLSIPSLVFGKILNLRITDSWIYEARLSEILILLVLFVFVLDVFLNKALEKLKVDKISFLLAVYLLLALFSYSYIVDFHLFIFGLKIIAFSFFSYFLAINLLDKKKKILWFFYSISATALILSFQLFYKFYTMGFSSRFFFERHLILIPIGPVATTAAILAFLSPMLLAFYFALPNLNKTKPLVFVSFFFSFMAVVLTLGKGAILSLFLGFFFLFLKMKNKRSTFLLFFIWFALLIYLAFTPFFVGLFERIKMTFIDKNTSFRIKEYKTGWQIIRNHLFLGVGAGQQLYYYKKALNLEVGQQVNNYFLQVFVDFGLVGLFYGVYLFLTIFKTIKKALKKMPKNVMLYGFVASFVVAFFNSMVEVTIYALPYAIIFWVSLGTLINYEKSISNNN